MSAAPRGGLAGIADRLVRDRERLPRWLDRLITSVARNPDGIAGRLAAMALSGADPAPTNVPSTPVSVYIAPTNYAGQGEQWARSLERADARIGARNAAVVIPGGFAFPADTLVPIATTTRSKQWGALEFDAASQFTHVLVEAQRSMFGRTFDRDLGAEVAALQALGVSVAHLCHGTDIRDPDLHRKRTPWSPYPDDPRTQVLREDAARNLAFLREQALPIFVSTPDLLADVPEAMWCPVVVDPVRWAATTTDERDRVRVVHIPSSGVQKGSALIAPSMTSLALDGAIDYTELSGIPAASMPSVITAADIVLDQFRLGSYGVAACEAMAAGRVVVGHVLDDVRALVESTTGIQLPIVEATPATVGTVVADLAADPERRRAIGEAGTRFVAAVHDGRMSADALITSWIST